MALSFNGCSSHINSRPSRRLFLDLRACSASISLSRQKDSIIIAEARLARIPYSNKSHKIGHVRYPLSTMPFVKRIRRISEAIPLLRLCTTHARSDVWNNRSYTQGRSSPKDSETSWKVTISSSPLIHLGVSLAVFLRLV